MFDFGEEGKGKLGAVGTIKKKKRAKEMDGVCTKTLFLLCEV